MKKAFSLFALTAALLLAAACSSNEFNLTVDAVESGADYVLTIENAPVSSFQTVAKVASTAETIYAGYQKGDNTAEDVQNAINDLEANLQSVFEAAHIVDPKTQALATLTISEAGSLLSYITSIETGQTVHLVQAPSKTFKAAFNQTAGNKILK